MEEIWKDVVGYEGLYQVSNLGRVKSVITWNGYEYLKKEKIMKPFENKRGYKSIGFTKDGKTITYRLHRIVAQAFIPNPENKPIINHKNGVKSDNRVENLEWCTYSENTIHAIKTGLMVPKKGGQDKRSVSVNQFDKSGQFIKKWDSISEIKRELNYDKKAIISCCKGKLHYNTAYGYKWEYAEKD